jgi:hypothetical protein
MTNWPLLAVATKGGVATTALLLLGLGLLAGFVAIAAAQLRAAADRSEARSRGDVSSRLRALDELVAQGALRPEDYATRQAALLKEI